MRTNVKFYAAEILNITKIFQAARVSAIFKSFRMFRKEPIFTMFFAESMYKLMIAIKDYAYVRFFALICRYYV